MRSVVLVLSILLLGSGVARAADIGGVDVPDVNDIDLNRWDRAFAGVTLGGAAASGFEYGDRNTAIDRFMGAIGGVTAGLDMTLENGVVLGVAADATWLGLHGTVDGVDSDVYRLDWSASLRGRVGLDFGNLLPYATAGVVVAEGGTSNLDQTDFATALYTGLVAGVGVEIGVGDQMSVDVGYRYTWYGDQEYGFSTPFPGVSRVGFDSHQVVVGVNWAF